MKSKVSHKNQDKKARKRYLDKSNEKYYFDLISSV